MEVPDPFREFVSLVPDEDGSWRLSGRLGADQGAVVDAAMREVADALFRDSGRLPNGAAVLAEMAQRSLDTVTEPSRRDRYRVHLTLDEQHRLVDRFGQSLPDWLFGLMTCGDARMQVTWTRAGVPVDTGASAGEIPAPIRRYVLARDGGCRVPGCGARRHVHLHHIRHREHGGDHDPRNLVVLCPHHHRMHHRGQLDIAGDAEGDDGVRFTRPDGRPFGANTWIRPPGAPPPPTGQYRHPRGERLDLRWISPHPPRSA